MVEFINDILPFLLGVVGNFINLQLVFALSKKEVKFTHLFITTILVSILYEALLSIIPDNFRYIIPLVIVLPIAYVFKIKVLRVLLSVLVTNIIIGLIDIVITFSLFYYLGVENVEQITNYTAFYYMGFVLLYTSTIIVARLIKYFNYPIRLSDESKQLDLGIVFNYVFALLLIFPNAFILLAYLENKSLTINNIAFTVISMIAMFISSILYSQNRYNSLLYQQEIEYQRNYNTTLKTLLDGLRAFRHDYKNTLATLYGYVQLGDMESLERVFKEVLEESKTLTTLDKLNPNLIKSPSLYGLITSKYQRCEQNNVMMNIEIFAELENMEIRTFDLTRMLGIFLDNSIEAASASKVKKVNFVISEKENHIIFKISNTFVDNAVDVEKIFDNGISSKGKNRGLGLYKVKDIVNRYKDISLNTYIEDKMFVQQLAIPKSIVLSKANN